MLAALQPTEKEVIAGLDFQSLATLENKTALWLKKRQGRFTASEFHRLMGYENKDGLSKGARSYAFEKATETLLSEPLPSYHSKAMERGSQLETEAMEHFIQRTGLQVEKYGDNQEFVTLGQHVGCTPDGILPGGGVEGKAPEAKTHLFYLLHIKNACDLKKHAKEYYWQLMGSMYVTHGQYWHFFSYDPRFSNPKHRMLLLRVERNEEDIEKLQRKLQLAIAFKNEILEKLIYEKNRKLP